MTTYTAVIILLVSILLSVGVVKAFLFIEDHGWVEAARVFVRGFLFCLLVAFIYFLINFFIKMI